MSRPFVLALLAAVLASATFVSMRSAGERARADSSTPAPTVHAVTPKPAKAPSKADAAPSSPKSATANQTKAAPAKPPVAKKAADTGVPPKVQKALDARRIVVLFFRQGGADDSATASAVRSLRGTKRVSIFTAELSKLARYRRVIADLGVTQAPSVVIVGKDRKAALLEGFIDSGTLKQRVRDAR